MPHVEKHAFTSRFSRRRSKADRIGRLRRLRAVRSVRICDAAGPPRAKSVVSGSRIPYGAAVRSDTLVSDLSYRDAIIANCQIIVPESELKWLELRPTRGEYRFEKADMLVDFARQNRLELRGHTLAWYGAMPAWTNEIGSRAEAERELTDHIETVVSRYRGAIPSWDVINEPLAEWPENEFVVPSFDLGQTAGTGLPGDRVACGRQGRSGCAAGT